MEASGSYKVYGSAELFALWFLLQTTQHLEKCDILGFYRGYMAPDFEHEDHGGHYNFKHVAWKALQELGSQEGLPPDLVEKEFCFRMVGSPGFFIRLLPCM